MRSMKIFHNRKTHTDQLKNLMIEIVSVILAEYESIPFQLLELLFVRIIDPEKVRQTLRIIRILIDSNLNGRNYVKNVTNWSNQSFVEMKIV